MQNSNSSDSTFFVADLPPEELERILERIDENLAFRAFFQEKTADSNVKDGVDEMQDLPILSIAQDDPSFNYPLLLIQNSHAPYYVVDGNPFVRLIKSLFNLPILIFGRKQAYFNRLALELLNMITAYLGNLRNQREVEINTINMLSRRLEQMSTEHQNQKSQLESLTAAQENQGTHLESLAADWEHQKTQVENLTADRENYQAQLGSLTAAQENQGAQLESLAADWEHQKTQLENLTVDRENHSKWMEHLAANQDGISKWVDIVARKQEMLALDVREGLATAKGVDVGLPEPIITDPERYMQRMSEMRGIIKVNLGCGEKLKPDYFNIDLRPVPGVDIVADARHIPYEPGTITEIASAHLFEHFREHESRVRVLPYWKSLLKLGGIVRIICPNWAAMLEQLNSGKMALTRFKQLTFGSQDYKEDDHFAMYTPETLSALLQEVGFDRIQVLVIDRDNGGCPEMELVATRLD